jgi:pimeloyl-ACP methyl ester carboxylesterase
MKTSITTLFTLILFSVVSAFASLAMASECRDAVVLVHGNTGTPSDWDNTYDYLIDNGYSPSEIILPNWGSKTCPSCNDHYGYEETPVANALNQAVAVSCTGKVDVISHSMGVTLSAKKIIDLGIADKVDTFVGIAGAWKGLWSCGVYPWNVWSSTCGRNGLSIGSPLLGSIDEKPIASKIYTFRSAVDQIVCGTGVCTVGGVHSSRISGENESFLYNYGHFGLQKYTADKQFELIQ